MLTAGPWITVLWDLEKLPATISLSRHVRARLELSVLLWETRLEVQLCGGWAGWKGGLHSPSLSRAGCSHWGCWGRSQDWGISALFGEAEGLVGVSLSLKQHKNTRSQMDFSSSDKAFGFLLSPDSWALLCLSSAQFSPLEAAQHWLAGNSLNTCGGSFSRTFPLSLLLTSFPLWDLDQGFAF